MEHNHKEHKHNNDHDHKNKLNIKLLLSIILNLTITISEIIGGLVSNSLSLLSDAVHNLSDTVSIVLTYISIKIGSDISSPKIGATKSFIFFISNSLLSLFQQLFVSVFQLHLKVLYPL